MINKKKLAQNKIKVTIIQRVLPHYRIPLFRLLSEKLNEKGIEFRLIYGQEYPGTVPKTIFINEHWSKNIKNIYFNILGRQVVWQPCLSFIDDSDLLIFEQANFLLINYWLLFKRRFRKKFWLAYWGHGKNLQAKSGLSISEKIKKAMIKKVDWWFAYTDLTTTILGDAGFSDERITTVQNAVDTTSLKQSISKISQHEICKIENQLSLKKGAVALFCGGMYENKKLDFLFEACAAIRLRTPDFQVLLIGDGPEQSKAEQISQKFEWIHYLGPKFGEERAVYFKLADVFLMPGLVGLGILDSFVAGIPLFTTDIPIHSPEITYLELGINGFITKPSIEDYVDSVCLYFQQSPEYKQKVKSSCISSADSYTLENMAQNFAEGIQSCINLRNLHENPAST